MNADKEFPRTFVPESLDVGDFEAVRPLLERLLARPLDTASDLETWLLDVSELQACMAEERSRRYIAMTRDTGDEIAERRYLELVEGFLPKVKPHLHGLNQTYLAAPARQQLLAEGSGRYDVLDREIAAEIELYREENIPLQTEASLLSQRYQKVSGSMTMQFRGQEQTMPQMAKHLEEQDRDLRREAWMAIVERRLTDRDTCDEIFDELIALRARIAANADCAGYRDYTFRALQRFDYTPADCFDFHDAVERTVVPLARELAEQRRQTMGLEELRPWDMAADSLGRPPLRPFSEGAELADGVAEIFARLDPELAAQFASMRTHGELDLESRKGKAPGGYMSTLEEVRRPFIFMNAAGVHRDVETLLHESGHAFHAIAARAEPLVGYRHAPIEFAEVASMTMELFGDDHLDAFYSDADAARAKRKHLEGIIQLLPWVAWIDAFQHWIYTHPDHSREDRTAKWLALESRFGEPVEWGEHTAARQSSWQRQLHLFCYPFYYIEYGIAQLGALQIWRNAKRDHARALAAYRRALALGGSRRLPELFASAEAVFSFDQATVAPLIDLVSAELMKLPQ